MWRTAEIASSYNSILGRFQERIFPFMMVDFIIEPRFFQLS